MYGFFLCVGTLVAAIAYPNKKSHPVKAKQAIEQKPAPSYVCDEKALGVKALCQYGVRLNVKHKAEIAMNTCSAWNNTEKGLTVTYNPGFVSLNADHSTLKYLVFSSGVDTSDYNQDVQTVHNGPVIFTSGGKTYNEIDKDAITVFYSPGDLSDHVSDRTITSTPTIDPLNHEYYYSDTTTGQPIIKTELTSGPLNIQNVYPICNRLRGVPLSSSNPTV